MTDVTSRLRLVVDSSGLDRAGRKLKDLQGDAKGLDNTARLLQRTFSGLASVLGTGFAIGGLVKIAEEFTTIQNRLRLVTSGATEFKSVLGDLGKISRESQSALETTVTLYSRLAQFAGDAFDSQKQILDFTGAIQNAFLAAGAGAQEASNAVRQLAQGLASGELRGEEFRSVAEQAPLLAKAITEAVGDGSKSAFELAKEGAFTTEVVIDAVLGKLKEFQEQAALVSPTIGRALQVLKDQFTLTFGQDLSGLSSQFAGFLLDFANNLQTLRPLIEGVAAALGTLVASFALLTTAAALPVIFAALVNPITLVAIAIGGIVAFRDDIAEWAFGVRDAGAVVHATFEVLGGVVTTFVDKVLQGALVQRLGEIAEYVLSVFKAIGQGVADTFASIDYLINRGQIQALTKDYERLVEKQADLNAELRKAESNPTENLLSALGSDFEIGTERIKAQLDEVNGKIAETNTELNNLLNPGVEFTVGGLFDDIKKRATEIAEKTKEVADSGMSTEITKAATASTELAKNTGEAAKQAANIAKMFADLETERKALLAGSDREADVIRLTADLLANQADHYASMKGDASALAKSDAERLVDAKATNKALDARNKMMRDLADQRELIAAAALGEREERIAREVLAIRREIAGISVDEARNLAEQNVLAEKQLDLIREQRALIEAPFDNLADSLTEAIVSGGAGGVKGLKRIFGSFLSDLKRSFLTLVFQPLIQQFTGMLQGTLGSFLGGFGGFSPFTPGIAGGANPASSTLAAAGGAGLPFGGFNLGSLAQAGVGFGGLALGGGSSAFGLASLIGPGALGKFGASIGNFLGLAGGITDKLSGALAGAGTLGGAFGGIGGSLLSGAIFGQSNAQSIGSAIGGIAGNLIPIPVLGPLIGSFIGGTIGSLFSGTKKSTANISTLSGGLGIGFSSGKGKGREDQAISLGNAVIEAINSIASIIGGSIVAGLNLGSIGTRKSKFVFDPTGANRTKGTGVQSFATEEEAIRAAIGAALSKGVIAGDESLVALTKSLAGANVGLEQMANVLGIVKQITDVGKPAVSKYGEALKALDEALRAASASANGSAAAEQALAKARTDAVAALKGQFEKDIAASIEAIKDPALAGFRDLARELAAILSDAKALGVDISPDSDVMELLGLRIEEFFNQAAANGADIIALTDRLSELGNILKELGIDATVAAQALAKAKASQKETFNKQVQAEIGNFLTGPLDQLEKLLEAQEKRLKQAEALGADLAQVERLSALELRQFFQGLSESALNEVKDFLGLFQEASDSVARNLDLSRQDLRGKADQFAQFAEQFAGLRTDFRERFVAASPRESLDILRGRANDLIGKIGEGNESAAQALPQVLNQLVESARQSFGNTKDFQTVLDFAIGALTEAEKSAIGVKTEAERQIAALDASNDLLSEIRDILKSSQAFNALLRSSAGAGIASSAELLALIQSGAGLTPSASNDNAAALSVTGLIGRSIDPIVRPLADSINNFTQRLAEMPYLQRLQIEATERSADRIVVALDDVSDRLDRTEVLSKRQLEELERINRAA